MNLFERYGTVKEKLLVYEIVSYLGSLKYWNGRPQSCCSNVGLRPD